MTLTREQIDIALREVGADPTKFWHHVEEFSRRNRTLIRLDYRSTSEALGGLFGWGDTPEGNNYWENIYVQLQNLERLASLPKSICSCYWSRHPLLCRCPK